MSRARRIFDAADMIPQSDVRAAVESTVRSEVARTPSLNATLGERLGFVTAKQAMAREVEEFLHEDYGTRGRSPVQKALDRAEKDRDAIRLAPVPCPQCARKMKRAARSSGQYLYCVGCGYVDHGADGAAIQ